MGGGRRRRRAGAGSGRRRMVLVALAVLGSTGAVGAAAAALADTGDAASVSREESSPEEIRAFWTEKRREQAEPVEMPVDLVDCSGWRGWLLPECW
ncbi:hypothetical protein ACWD4J_13400 [Streptomyces sp. NPDC002577]